MARFYEQFTNLEALQIREGQAIEYLIAFFSQEVSSGTAAKSPLNVRVGEQPSVYEWFWGVTKS